MYPAGGEVPGPACQAGLFRDYGGVFYRLKVIIEPPRGSCLNGSVVTKIQSLRD